LPDIFLSYSRDDQATARRFAEGLERAGLSVWWDQTLSAGEAYDQVTEKALREAKAVVVLWSKRSVDSRWVRAEATTADRNKTLVPVMIEPCARPIMFELTHTAELAHWKGDAQDAAWQNFLADLTRFVRKDPVVSVAAAPVDEPAKRTSRRAMSIAMAAVAVLIVGAAWWSMSHRGGIPATQSSQGGTALAVLPFVNLSPDPEQEFFSDGLTEEILNQLAQVKDLRLTARTSSFAFKGKNEDVRVIGQQLGVANLLEGSIRKDGNQLRITAQLINATDGTHLWSKTYDREMSGVFAVQEEIARDVAQALSIKLDVGNMSRAQGGTTNIEAYEKYLKAQALLGQWKWDEAVPYYREAVALDPDFVRALVGLASVNGPLVNEQERTRASARVAELAPDSAWALLVRAQELMNQREWSEAEVALNKMIAGTSGWEDEAFLGAFFDMLTGRVNESLNGWQRLAQLDPLGLGSCTILAQALDAAGRAPQAQTEYERCRKLEGDHEFSELDALLRLWSRKDASPAAVRAQFSIFLQITTPESPLHKRMFELLGDKTASLAALHEAFENPPGQNWLWMDYVAKYADHYGDKDLALVALRRAYVDWRSGAVHNLWRPYETNLRTDPRFKEIVRNIGLVDYWRSSSNWGDYCKPVGEDDFECQ
jgi:TolB-like protein